MSATGFAEVVIEASGGKIVCIRRETNYALKFPHALKEIIAPLCHRMTSETVPLVVHAPSIRYDEWVTGERRVIGYTAWETERMASKWVEGCNVVDEVWIPSHHNLRVLRDSGVTVPIYVVPHAIDTERFKPAEVRLNGRFTFLSVFRWGLRKGWPELFAAYERAFSADDPVTLRVLTNYRSEQYRLQGQSIIDHFQRPGKPRVEILEPEYVPYDFMPPLYQNADVFVLPSRGEGFCLPCAEAMACGLPAIVTDATAFPEYVGDENGSLVKCTPVSADDSTDPDRSSTTWQLADINDLAAKMRRAYDDAEWRTSRGTAARKTIISKFGFAPVARTMIERLVAND